MSTGTDETPMHRAARVSDSMRALAERRLRQRGWRTMIVPYAGYGAPGWARVICRVLLRPADPRPPRRRTRYRKVRGWRSFTSLPAQGVPVTIVAGTNRVEAHTDRGGFVDLRVDADLPPGWARVRLESAGTAAVHAPIRVVDESVRFGVVSDVDDTVMVTALPRPMLAAWNTFVLDEHARASVPGMAVLYERLVTGHPGAPVLYLSTGAWNVAPALSRFLSRHLFPPGPLLLTDWGPTTDSWFRSGTEHKRATLRRLAAEFPHIRWLLIGDDGQHDEKLYAEFAAAYPEHVAGVAIRRLSPTQSLLARGLPAPHGAPHRHEVTWLSAPDGAGLSTLLRQAGLLPPDPE